MSKGGTVSNEEKQVRKIARLGAAIGRAWGASGFGGPPRFVIFVRDERGDWRVASTESNEEMLAVVEAVVAKPPEPTHVAGAPYTDKGDVS